MRLQEGCEQGSATEGNQEQKQGVLYSRMGNGSEEFSAWEPKRKENTGLDNPGENLHFGVTQLLLNLFSSKNTVCVSQGNSCLVTPLYCEPMGR